MLGAVGGHPDGPLDRRDLGPTGSEHRVVGQRQAVGAEITTERHEHGPDGDDPDERSAQLLGATGTPGHRPDPGRGIEGHVTTSAALVLSAECPSRRHRHHDVAARSAESSPVACCRGCSCSAGCAPSSSRPSSAATRRQAELSAAADAAVGWFVSNQRDDGAWLYRYDRDTDTDVGGYNITRHAGVTMSLEQAAGAALAESEAAAASAERGIEWALDRMYDGPGWRAFAGEGDGQFGSGASALLDRRPRAAPRANGRRSLRRRAPRPRRLPDGDGQRAWPGVRHVRPGRPARRCRRAGASTSPARRSGR